MIFENKNVHYLPRTAKAGRLGFFHKKSQHNSKKYKQFGRSMIEMLGVLAIVGVLSAGGIAGYSMAMQSYKTNALIEKVQLIAQVTRSLYKNGDYAGISSQVLLDSGKISDVQNPFGGDIHVGTSGALGTGYVVIYTDYNTPADSCVDILGIDWGNNGVFFGISVYRSSEYDFFSHGSVANAISYCKGGNRRMMWTIK